LDTLGRDRDRAVSFPVKGVKSNTALGTDTRPSVLKVGGYTMIHLTCHKHPFCSDPLFACLK
uniref:Uncharacterized protein n=1 Tax=Anopheles minimus TaxID=112268 RepID=A0A182WQD1_9DIPT